MLTGEATAVDLHSWKIINVMIIALGLINTQVIADQLRVEKEREAELDILYQLVVIN